MEIISLICEKVSVARRGCSGKSVGIWVVQLRVTWKAARVVCFPWHHTLLDFVNLACPKLLPDTMALAVEQGGGD